MKSVGSENDDQGEDRKRMLSELAGLEGSDLIRELRLLNTPDDVYAMKRVYYLRLSGLLGLLGLSGLGMDIDLILL